MPILINEVVVTATASSHTSPTPNKNRDSGGKSNAYKQALIEECVEEVLKIIERKLQR